MPDVPSFICCHARSQLTWTANWESTAIPGQEQPSQRHLNREMPSQGQEAFLQGGQSTDMVTLRILTVTSFPSLLPTHSHPVADEETKL